MTAQTKLGTFWLVFVLVCAVSVAMASPQVAPAGAPLPEGVQAQAERLGLADPVPVDPRITTGRLPNGLRYYIRTNRQPENRAELRLAVNVGSVLEDDDQIGLAHFVEHMAFNGTRNFPGQSVIQFMESIGMRAGPSINAFTSFDETVYMLQVPTDDAGIVDKAFLVLADWAQNLSFTAEEIDKERGVIIEEWRIGRGANARMRDAQFPILFKDARYADRLVIGTRESLETFEHDALRRFYRDWYRPDMMALVAVGDFDEKAIERLVKVRFGAIPAAEVPRLRPTYDVPDHKGTLYAIATDKEATMTQISVYNKLPLAQQRTVAAYRDRIVSQLASAMFSARLTDLTRKPDSPFVMAAAGRSVFVRSKEAAILSAIPKEGAIEQALEALLVEAARVARHGFVQAELDRQKATTLRSYEQYLAEKDKEESRMLADRLWRNFTVNEVLPGPELEYALHSRFLPEITLEEVNGIARDWLNENSRVVMVSAPEKQGLSVPDEARLATVVAGIAAKEITAYTDTAGSRPLLAELPKPGAIAKVTSKEELGITEWVLSNGVKVVLKPTTHKEDEILFRATSPGGASLASDEDLVPAQTAGQVMSPGVMGLGSFDATDLRKVLAGKIASAGPFIGGMEEGLSGRASPKDLETMFQLIYLTFTAPRADKEAFLAHKEQRKAILANQQASPAWAFNEALQSIMTQDHPRARPLTADRIEQMDLDRSLAFYKDRFADASGFTFVFVGSFTPEMMQPLVIRYLASLPSLNRDETWKDIGINLPRGIVEKVVKKGIEPQGRVAIVFSGPFDYNRDQRVAIRALGMLLQTKLRETVREDLGGTYGVGASPNYTVIPREEYSFSIQFGCSPDRVDELVKVVFDEIELLKKNGPTEKQVSDVREAMLREFETNVKQNAYLLSQIYLRYQVPQDLGELFGLGEYYKTLDEKLIWDAARKYLRMDNYVKVVLLPEVKTESRPAMRPAA
jgi:zinc protease